jgi:hypothetical protein
LILPVGRHGDLVILVFGYAVEVLLGAPGNALFGHGIDIPLSVTPNGRQVLKGVVKHGIRDEAARVVWPVPVVNLERVAFASLDLRGCLRIALQLFNVQGLYIAAMVLVEVCEAVVEEDRRLYIFRDDEAEDAHVDIFFHNASAVPLVDLLQILAPFRGRIHLLAEGSRPML